MPGKPDTLKKLALVLAVLLPAAAGYALAKYCAPEATAARHHEAARRSMLLLQLGLDRFGQANRMANSDDTGVFPGSLQNESFIRFLPTVAKTLDKAPALINGLPVNRYTDEAMRQVDPELRSIGDYTYLPILTTIHKPGGKAETTVGHYLLMWYDGVDRADPSGSWVGRTWLINQYQCQLADSLYDHVSTDPWLDVSESPLLYEVESLGSALRRAGYEEAAAKLEASVPEERGRDDFMAYVAEQWQPLILAREFAAVRLLMEQGMDINEPLADGVLPLHHFVRSFDLCSVQSLLDLGADVNARDPASDASALMLALQTPESAYPLEPGNTTAAMPEDSRVRSDLVSLLLERGADPALADKSGLSPADLRPDLLRRAEGQ